jgi:N-acetylneuraminic acid mutarotase
MKIYRWFYTTAAIGTGIFSIVILLSLPAAAQTPRPITSGAVVPSTDNPISGGSPAIVSAVLYDQYDNPTATVSNSQNFEPVLDDYDDFLADDFEVPDGRLWHIDQVEVQGQYFNGTGPADSMNIFIYTNAITTPGSLVASRTNITYTNILTEFSIRLASPIVLAPGKYWLSVQANQSFNPTGEWGWTDRTITNTQSAAWQNPSGGFGICPAWDRRTVCIGNTAAGDQVFRLLGTISPPIQPLACSAGTPGAWEYRNFISQPSYGPGAASDGQYAYVTGGYSFLTLGDITQTVRYDPAANTWLDLAPLPDARTMASVVYAPLNHKVYVFGGEIAETSLVFNTTFIYDIASNTWTTGAPMPDVRAFMSAGYSNGKIYLAGGYKDGSVTSAQAQTWVYDVLANTWGNKADMPQALGGAASAVVNGHLYVIGGRDNSTAARNQTYDYDIAHDTWSSRMDVPYGVNVPGAAVLQNKIWVIGGGNPFLSGEGGSSTASINAPQAFTTTLIYDPAANTWTAGPVLNVRRSFAGATGIGNFAIVVGGYDGSTSTGATEVTWICPEVHFSAATYTANENGGSVSIPVTLDPASLLTATVSYLSADATATAGSDYVAVTGTLTFTPGATNRTFSVSILDDDRYEDNETLQLILGSNINAALVPPNPAVLTILNNDPQPPLTCGYQAPGPWILHNFLPLAAYGPGVTNDGVYAYVLGGYSFQVGKDITQTVRYDPIANTWTALAPLPDARMMASVVYAPLNHKIYVLGGEKDSTGVVFNTTFIYDIASNTWTTGAPMPDVRAFMSGGYHNGKIYLAGGYQTGLVTSAQAQTWVYDVLANTWATKANMPEALGGAASAMVNGHLYVIGGRDGSTAARNQTYDYDIALNTWSTRLIIPHGVNVPGVAVVQDKIWVFGGGDPFLTLDAPLLPAGGSAPQSFPTTLIYDPAANSWTAGPNLNVGRSFTGGTGFGNFALAIGGYATSYATGATEVNWICPNDYLPTVIQAGP